MTLACCTCIPHRYLVVLLSFFMMLICVGYRVSFALMVTHIAEPNSTATNGSFSDGDSIFKNCTTPGTSKDRKVNWSGSVTNLFHTAYFAGQFITSIPAGALATRFSPKRMFGLTILATSILQLLLPKASEIVWLIYVIRCVQGMIEAVFVPAMNAVISAWAPRTERARLINIAYAGVYLAPALANFTTGATTCYISWDSIMYIYGSVGAAGSILWLTSIASSPATHPVARRQERQRLLGQAASARPQTKRTSITELPWKSFFTSLPVIAIWVGSFCRNVVFTMLITEAQQYYKDVYHLPTVMNGLLSAAPHCCMVVFMLMGSWIFDMIIKKELLSMTKTRKLAQTLGFGVQGVCVLVIGFVDNYIQAFVLFCVGAAFSAFAISGFQTNPLDIAPQYAGVLTGIVRTGMLGSVLSTVLASQLTGNSPTLLNWQHLFIIVGSIHIAGVIFYLIFASGNLQSWAQTDPSNEVGPTHKEQEAADNTDSHKEKLHAFAASSSGSISHVNGAAVYDSDDQPSERNHKEDTMTRNPNYGTVPATGGRV